MAVKASLVSAGWYAVALGADHSLWRWEAGKSVAECVGQLPSRCRAEYGVVSADLRVAVTADDDRKVRKKEGYGDGYDGLMI